MFSFCQLFRYKPVEEPGKRGGFLERLLTVVTSALQVIIMMAPVAKMMVVVVLILVMMTMIVRMVVILVGLDSEANFQRWAFVCDDDGGKSTINDEYDNEELKLFISGLEIVTFSCLRISFISTSQFLENRIDVICMLHNFMTELQIIVFSDI